MRIADSEGKPLSSVSLALSEREAAELIDALRDLRGAERGWHAHISAADCQSEVTIHREDDETAAV